MRKRFEQQLQLGQKPISEIKINLKYRTGYPKLVLALQLIFTTPEYNEKVFSILEDAILKNKKKTGRQDMNLWMIFVLAQTRLCLNISYDELFRIANTDIMLREIMGIELDPYLGLKPINISYQNIIDNVSLLDDVTVMELNKVIVTMGHDVFKKKRGGSFGIKD